MGVFDSEEIRAKIRKAIEDSDVSIHPGTLAGYDPSYPRSFNLGWDHPKADPLADLKAMYDKYGMVFVPPGKKGGKKVPGKLEYWTASDVLRHPYLQHCSKCGSERTKRVDPWITLKHCPNCGHVDEIREPSPEPTSLGWDDVQKLLVGILRQVPDNKVQVHPAEFDTTGITFKQETDTATGIVTIWFETSDEPVVQTPMCSSQSLLVDASGFVACTEPMGHSGDHRGVASPGAGRLTWTNMASGVVVSKCAELMTLDSGSKVNCFQPSGHSGNHVGLDSWTHATITWSRV